MDNHKKKMIAPVVITVLIVIYYIVYFALVIKTVEGIARYILGVIPLRLAGVMIKVCIERIKEIEEGEEDDLGKY